MLNTHSLCCARSVHVRDLAAALGLETVGLGHCRSHEELVLAVGRAFAGWHEGKVSFPPTFKFKRGTTQYLGHDEVQPAELQSPFQTAANEPPLMPTTVSVRLFAMCLRAPPSRGFSSDAIIMYHALGSHQRGRKVSILRMDD